MAGAPHEPEFRRATRMPLRAPVRLHFGPGEELSGHIANLSSGGFFVGFRPPKPVGTLVRFEIDLPGGATPLAGFGEVVWIRVRDESKTLPAGMGIRFRHLPDPGPELLRAQLARSEEFLALAAASGITDEAVAEGEEEGSIPSWRIKYPKPVLGLEDEETGVAETAVDGEAASGAREAAGGALEGPEASPPEALPPGPEPRSGPSPTFSALGEVAPSRPTWQRPALLGAAGLLLLAAALLAGRALLGGGGGAGGAAAPSPAASGDGPAPAPESLAGRPAGSGDGPAPVPESLAGRAGEPPVEPPAAAAPAEPALSGPASRVREISWGKVPGETIVVLAGDGTLAAERVSHQRLAGSLPRELVRISGITAPYQEAEIAVGTPELLRIRTGHHPESDELFVVLDLPGPGYAIDRLENQPSAVRVYLRARPR